MSTEDWSLMPDEEEDGGDNWRETRERVLERDGGECRFCGISNQEHREKYDQGLHAHHIIPDGDGGADTVRNLVAVCKSCHRTLESLHGKAMGEIASSEDYAEDLEGVNRTVRDFRERADRLDDRLAEFMDGHPTFSDHFGVYDEGENKPIIHSLELQGGLGYDIPDLQSEWDFAVGYGYKEGVVDVLGCLNSLTDVPFEEVGDGE